MSDDKSQVDVSKALAEHLNLDTQEPGPTDDVQAFFKEAGEAMKPPVEPKGPAESQPAKYVHEPTGKEFETELDLVKYNNGYDVQRLGEQNKELRKQLEELTGKVEQASSQQQQPVQDRNQLKKQIWQNASDEILAEPAADFVLQGLEGAAALLTQQMQGELQKRDALIEKLSNKLEESDAYANSGVDRSAEQKFLEKHPGLAAMAPKDRVALVKDLLAVSSANAGQNKLVNRISAGTADHVEESALAEPQSTGDAMAKQFESLNDPKKELGVLGELVRQQGSFLGYSTDGF
jgi:hypothetical protein